MDIQVLNEIASLARKASLSKVSASVSANAQLKGLKGNPVPAPGNPAPPALEGSLEQIQAPVTPEISSVARAASAYSAAVGDGLNSDELKAIQDLSGKVRTAVSDFLSQPGLAQAENAATVVASNPEAVQNLTASVEQAVVETLNLPAIEGEVIVNATPLNTDVLEEVPAPENFISLERITNGAEPNNPVVAASPALVNSRASVETPVTVEKGVVTSNRDFRVTPASPALQNAQAGDHARVETPVSRPDAIASSQQESVRRPETVAVNPQETPVIAASPALQNANAQSRVVENSVNAENAPATSNRDFRVTPASPALQNANAQSRVVENSVNAENAPPTSNRDFTVIAASPALVNSRASVETPVTVEEGVETSNRDFRVTPASPALQNANAQSRVVENAVDVANVPATSNRDFTVTAASPALQNAQARNAEVVNPVNISPASVTQGQGSAGVQV